MGEGSAVPTVLVVDDDEGIRDALKLLLTSEGYSVSLASSGERALELMRRCIGTGVVLFDYLMPEGSGLDLLRGVAEDEALRRRFTYVCMAARDRSRLPTEFNELLDEMQIAFVAKPFDLDDLLRAVNDARAQLPVGD